MDDNFAIEQQVCFALYSASNAVTRAYKPLLEKLDLTYLQYMTMIVLWKEGSLNVKDISAKLGLDSGTLTPLLRRLELKGLVERTRCETDERVRLISLTEAGAELKASAVSIPNEMACKAKLNLGEAHELKALCDRLLQNLS